MASVKDQALDTVDDVRRNRLVAHVLRMVKHYGSHNGNNQSGAVTYFAFLSFFPILALAFFVVGIVSNVYPGAREDLVQAIDSLLPGFIGDGENEISLADIRTFSGWAGLIALAGVLYAGLGWLSAMRQSLEVVFETPEGVQPNFVFGKLRDLVSLVTIGVTLLVSVAFTGFLTAFSSTVLGWVGLGDELSWLLTLITRAIGLVANAVLFFTLFKLLGQPRVPNRALWHGAFLGAVGFEVLKSLSFLLLGSTKDQPAAQAFGIALILLVWINYFSRLVFFSASWAFTSPLAVADRIHDPVHPVQGPPLPSTTDLVQDAAGTSRSSPSPTTAFAAGAAVAGTVAAVLRRGRRGRT